MPKVRSYPDDDDRLRCQRCDGYVAEDATSCGRCESIARRKREAEEAARRRAEREAEREELSRQLSAGRLGCLERYVHHYLDNSRRFRAGDEDALPPAEWARRNPLEMPRYGRH